MDHREAPGDRPGFGAWRFSSSLASGKAMGDLHRPLYSRRRA